eukprot:2438876-Heterocapsa_arctica.AAC.1
MVDHEVWNEGWGIVFDGSIGRGSQTCVEPPAGTTCPRRKKRKKEVPRAQAPPQGGPGNRGVG